MENAKEEQAEKTKMKDHINKRKYDTFDYLRNKRYFLRNKWQSKYNVLYPLCKGFIKNHIAYLTLLVVISNGFLAYYNSKANSRAEKLFVGQAKPLIDAVPFGIVQSELGDENKTKMCTTLLSFANYSGFTAKEISIDIKYGNNVWISEWVKANTDSERKKKEGVDPNVNLNQLYISRRKIAISELKPGQTKRSDIENPFLYASGQLDLKENVVGKKDGFPILVRVTWKSEDEHVFEKITKYKLLCTTTGIGHAFTFINEGIVSQTIQD